MGLTSHTAGVQIVLAWHCPGATCSCSGHFLAATQEPQVLTTPPPIEIEPGPGRYVQVCTKHKTTLREVRESRTAPSGLWCDECNRGPSSWFVRDTVSGKILWRCNRRDGLVG